MLEKDLVKGIIDVARLFGWRCAHFRPAMTQQGWRTPVQGDGKGFPDLVLVRDRVIYVEAKVGGNTLSPEQTDWLEALRAAAQEAYVWTNRDWEDGIVEAVLRREPKVEVAA